MNATDWIVIAAGVAAIAWVNWYFFLAGRQAATATATAGTGREASSSPAA